MDDLIGLFLVAVPVGYSIVQAVMLRRFRGAWRWAAALPLAAWGVWAVVLGTDVLGDRTAHNLFPFEILIGASLSMMYLGGVVVARSLFRK